jgi:hypothetical protein
VIVRKEKMRKKKMGWRKRPSGGPLGPLTAGMMPEKPLERYGITLYL